MFNIFKKKRYTFLISFHVKEGKSNAMAHVYVYSNSPMYNPKESCKDCNGNEYNDLGELIRAGVAEVAGYISPSIVIISINRIN
mgnify:CR=1 FL=1